jgi:hypothetical protein
MSAEAAASWTFIFSVISFVVGGVVVIVLV